MMGFVLKDFLVMKKTITYYLLVMAVYGALAVAGIFPYSIVSGFVTLVGMMCPMSTFAYDEQARWEKYAAATPTGRRGVVQGKYAFMLLTILSASVLTLIVLEAMYFLGKGGMEGPWEPLLLVSSMVGVTLLINSFILPVMFKYGSEKSRAVSLVIFVTVFGSMALLGYLTETRGVDLHPIFQAVASWSPAMVLGVVVVAELAILVLSYQLSLRIYAKREL